MDFRFVIQDFLAYGRYSLYFYVIYFMNVTFDNPYYKFIKKITLKIIQKSAYKWY